LIENVSSSARAENPAKSVRIPPKLSQNLENFFAGTSGGTRVVSSAYVHESALLPKLDVRGSNPLARLEL
jgi:hypothetical protein